MPYDHVKFLKCKACESTGWYIVVAAVPHVAAPQQPDAALNVPVKNHCIQLLIVVLSKCNAMLLTPGAAVASMQYLLAWSRI